MLGLIQGLTIITWTPNARSLAAVKKKGKKCYALKAWSISS